MRAKTFYIEGGSPSFLFQALKPTRVLVGNTGETQTIFIGGQDLHGMENGFPIHRETQVELTLSPRESVFVWSEKEGRVVSLLIFD